MSLASDYSQGESNALPPQVSAGDRMPRWTKMRSREGSEASMPIEEADGRRMLYSRPRSEGSLRDSGRGSPQGGYPGSGRGSPQGGYPGSSSRFQPQPMADDARRAVAAGKAMENTDIKKLVEHIGQSCMDNYGSLDKALRDIRYDSNGNVSRADMKIWFESHRVAIRMANKFF